MMFEINNWPAKKNKEMKKEKRREADGSDSFWKLGKTFHFQEIMNTNGEIVKEENFRKFFQR